MNFVKEKMSLSDAQLLELKTENEALKNQVKVLKDIF
jgi:hypothetical protein